MARKNWKLPTSVTLSKDVVQILKRAERFSKINRSSIVETAILFWWDQKAAEWGGKEGRE